MDCRIYFGSKLLIEKSIVKEFSDYSLVNSYNTESTVKNYSQFFDNNKIYLHHCPSNENLKLLDTSSGNHFIFFDDDSFDGRISIIQKIKKKGLIFDFSYPVIGDTSNLKRIVQSQFPNIKIEHDCWLWINTNCPMIKIKSKVSGSKKEKLCYDIDILINEINKITSIKDNLVKSDLENNSYNAETDIFKFIELMLSNKISDCINKLGSLLNSIGDQGLLLIILSQLNFLIKVSYCKENRIDINKASEILELKDILGKYLSDQWTCIEAPNLNENVIRIQIEYSKHTPSTKKLSKVYQIVSDTISKIRSHGNAEHNIIYMLHKVDLV